MHLFLLALLLLYMGECEAQGPPYQVDWVPDKFVVYCENEPCKLTGEQRSQIAEMTTKAVAGMKNMPFPAPQNWGPRWGHDTENDRIMLFLTDKGIAAAAAGCGKNYDYMNVGPDGFEPYFLGRDYLSYYFMSHEIFHLTQHDTPMWKSVKCGEVPDWIIEATATAVGLESMRQQQYPGLNPTGRDTREAEMFSGQRRYDEPLAYDKQSPPEDPKPAYYTASFWRHIAEAYHGGSYEYLNRYMRNPPPSGDWVSWLSHNVETDLGFDLGTVFSGFLANYAGWGDRGGSPPYPGTFFDQAKWLQGSFGGCKDVYLDKARKHDSVEVEILPLSGQCIEVHVSATGENGLKIDELASIQVAAVVPGNNGRSRKGLNLSRVSSNDETEFHCAKAARSGRSHGVGKCIMIGDDGELHLDESKSSARVWNILPQGPDRKRIISEISGNLAISFQKPGKRQSELTNLFTISYTPANVSGSETRNGGRNPVKARVHFVFDVVEEKASMDYGKGSGDVPDIAATLPIKLDLKDWAYMNRAEFHKVGEQYVGYGAGEGVIEPCHLAFVGRNSETNESITFNMLHPGAVTPGDYEFANRFEIASETEYLPQRKAPGMVVGSFTAITDPSGPLKSFQVTAGTLTIEAISGSVIQGYLTAYGDHREWSEKNRRKETTMQRAIALRFLLDLKKSAIEKYTPEPYACLLPESIDDDVITPPSSSPPSSRPSARPGTPPTPNSPQASRPDAAAENETTQTAGAASPASNPAEPPSAATPESSRDPEPDPPGTPGAVPDIPEAHSRPRYSEPYRNRFYLKSTGGVEYEHTLIDDDFQIYAGCTGTDPLTTGFVSMLKQGFTDRDWFQVGTEEVVGPGDTGTYDTRFMMWLNGVEPSPAVPEIKVSRKFNGEGILVINKHIASYNERRLQGTVQGTVKQDNGELVVQIFAEFDLDQSCGTK